MTQNQPITDPPTNPIPRNTTIAIADNSASETDTAMGARIMGTLVTCQIAISHSEHES